MDGIRLVRTRLHALRTPRLGARRRLLPPPAAGCTRRPASSQAAPESPPRPDPAPPQPSAPVRDDPLQTATEVPGPRYLGGIPPAHPSSTMTTASPAELDRLSTPVIEYLLRHMRPPERPDTCCGSGCAHCVWDTYEESWEEFKERRDELTREMLRRGLEPPPAPRLEKAEMDESLRVLRDLERKLNEGK